LKVDPAADTDFERLFFRAITWPTGVADFLAKADESTRRAFEAMFTDSSEFGAVERMQVYAEAYFYRLAGVLGEQFPITAYVVEETAFHNLATDYVLECPSRNPDVRAFGASFADYVENHAVSRDHPCLAEVARIEWGIVEALGAPDETPLDATSLATLRQESWPGLRLVPSAALRVMPCRADFPALWEACRSNVPRRDFSLAERTKAEWIATWRRGFELRHRILSTIEASALRGLADGLPFSEWCERARAENADVGPKAVAEWLRMWVDSGMIVGMLPG
jgi:hypothetical protein